MVSQYQYLCWAGDSERGESLTVSWPLIGHSDTILASDWLTTGPVSLVSGHNIVISDDSQETTSHLLPQHQH